MNLDTWKCLNEMNNAVSLFPDLADWVMRKNGWWFFLSIVKQMNGAKKKCTLLICFNKFWEMAAIEPRLNRLLYMQRNRIQFLIITYNIIAVSLLYLPLAVMSTDLQLAIGLKINRKVKSQ